MKRCPLFSLSLTIVIVGLGSGLQPVCALSLWSQELCSLSLVQQLIFILSLTGAFSQVLGWSCALSLSYRCCPLSLSYGTYNSATIQRAYTLAYVASQCRSVGYPFHSSSYHFYSFRKKLSRLLFVQVITFTLFPHFSLTIKLHARLLIIKHTVSTVASGRDQVEVLISA